MLNRTPRACKLCKSLLYVSVYVLWTYLFIKISKKLNLKYLLGMETTTYVGFEGNFMSRHTAVGRR